MLESLPAACARTATPVSEGFDAMAIEVIRSVRRPIVGKDRSLDGLRSVTVADTTAAHDAAAECLDILAARFGPACLAIIRPDPGHRAEGIGRFVPRDHEEGSASSSTLWPTLWHDLSLELRECRGLATPTWRPPRPEPVLFVADATVRWRGREHPIRRVGGVEIRLAPWWQEANERILRRIERFDGLGLWIERERHPGERLSSVDILECDRLDPSRSPACRYATWRLIGIGA